MKRIIILTILLICVITLSAQSRKSLLLRSLLIPGWGQVHSGNSYGYMMMATEVGIISSLFYFDNEHDLKRKEAYEYAMKYASVYPGSYSDEYFSHLSRYNSSGFEAGGYNSIILEQAMAIYPDRPDMQQQYLNANIYTDEMAWNWDSDSKRRDYGNIRGDMNSYKDYARIMSGVLILNHLISVVDILRMDSETKRSNVHFGIQGQSPSIILNYNF